MPPDYTPKTDEEIADAVLDRLRGGPKARLRAFATEVELSYEELLDRMQQFIECDGNDVTIHLGFDTPDYDHGLLWDAYELVTGTKVPSDIRAGYMVGCAC